MIVLLTKLDLTDKGELIDLIKHDEVNNLQFMEYLPYLSNEDDRFGFYGHYDHDKLVGALYYSPFNTGFAIKDPLYIYNFFKEALSTTTSSYIFGRHDYIQRLGEIPDREVHVYRYGSLPIAHHKSFEVPKEIQPATKQNIPAILSFYKDKDIMIEVEDRIHSIIEKGSMYIVKEEERIVSAALAHSETDHYALVGAVYTEEDYQGNGYGIKTLKALVQHLHDQNKTPYLFYEEALPHLERMYASLSFEHHTDIWMLY